MSRRSLLLVTLVLLLAAALAAVGTGYAQSLAPATAAEGGGPWVPLVYQLNPPGVTVSTLLYSDGTNIGIGTTTPTARLQVNGNIRSSGTLDITGANSRVRFLHNTMAELPSANSYHGMLAHVHSEGKVFFAHLGQWHALANEVQVLELEAELDALRQENADLAARLAALEARLDATGD